MRGCVCINGIGIIHPTLTQSIGIIHLTLTQSIAQQTNEAKVAEAKEAKVAIIQERVAEEEDGWEEELEGIRILNSEMSVTWALVPVSLDRTPPHLSVARTHLNKWLRLPLRLCRRLAHRRRGLRRRGLRRLYLYMHGRGVIEGVEGVEGG